VQHKRGWDLSDSEHLEYQVNSWKRVAQSTVRTDSVCTTGRFRGITSEVIVTLKPSSLRLVAGLSVLSAVFGACHGELVSDLGDLAKVVVCDRGSGRILHSTGPYIGKEADAKAREIYKEIRILGRGAFLKDAGSQSTA
jgi:hypothetical protein